MEKTLTKKLRPASTFPRNAFLYIFSLIILIAGIGCTKDHQPIPVPVVTTGPDASTYDADVLNQWLSMQIRLMRDATGIPNNGFARYYAYSGAAAYEALKPGISKSANTISWNGLTDLPVIDGSQKYYWPASVNAALAQMNRNIFTTATAADKAAIDSLEKAIADSFGSGDSAAVNRSNIFGKAIATSIFTWGETDGYKNASAAYTPPSFPGAWIPTPPALAAATTPFWGNNRPMVANSGLNTQPGAPIAYSENADSPFYKMAMQLYTISQTLTTDQKNQAIFWKDIPGVTSPGHWLSILQQVIKQTSVKLDKAVYSYALTGTCVNDALISCWITKYKYNLIRPISFIQKTYPAWATVIPTPAHPEYASAHAILSAAAVDAFTNVFGDIGSFSDHTYDYLGYPVRTYASFTAIGEDAGNSRVYAGIHYAPTVASGLLQGRAVTANIIKSVAIGK